MNIYYGNKTFATVEWVKCGDLLMLIAAKFRSAMEAKSKRGCIEYAPSKMNIRLNVNSQYFAGAMESLLLYSGRFGAVESESIHFYLS